MAPDLENNAALQDTLIALDGLRKKVMIAGIKAVALISTGVLMIFFFPFMFGIITGLLITGGGIYVFGKTSPQFREYKLRFKQEVVGTLLRNVDESLLLEPYKGITEAEFIDSLLFSQQPDRYSAEDYTSGMSGKTGFYYSEVHAEYKTETRDDDGKERVSWHNIFKGIVFTADFNKHFKGITVVRPKDFGATVGRWVGKVLPLFSTGGMEHLELENDAFCRTFVTQATDQIEARYILTPALMEKLLELNKGSGSTISLSFIRSRVYIAIPLNRNYFEAPFFSSVLRLESLEQDIAVIRFLFGIAEELGLNTRIWGKT